jgi:hypothetical protein
MKSACIIIVKLYFFEIILCRKKGKPNNKRKYEQYDKYEYHSL